ncbi:thioredoxin domain-containing protein [Stieleria sp. ICT_E10.1]|uniref:Thioredoxin-1 n=1 Tax=Stieleria magnilauensis TaxID=2527963 RepID=A0ABX5XTV8_9BACT|nr:thioredoxin domain-containing protein [Stieleria sedimenti]MCS7466317.1 thioredoxin domain-containing protein [Stieleria sedimenti]QDV85354.1 Thioredoxin-1 [Planctomycetes bacterium TBK1r]
MSRPTPFVAEAAKAFDAASQYRNTWCVPLRITSAFLFLAAFISGCQRPTPQTDANAGDHSSAIQLTDDNFQSEVIESDLPVLVDMWAPWCGPCIEMKPTIEEFAAEIKGTAKVGALNVDENPFVTEKYEIDKYPTLILFEGGVEVKRVYGKKTLEQLRVILSD